MSYSWATMRTFQVFSPNMQISCIFWMTFEKIIKIYLNFTLSVPFLHVSPIDFMYCLLPILLHTCHCHSSLYHRCHWRCSLIKVWYRTSLSGPDTNTETLIVLTIVYWDLLQLQVYTSETYKKFFSLQIFINWVQSIFL